MIGEKKGRVRMMDDDDSGLGFTWLLGLKVVLGPIQSIEPAHSY